MSSTCKTATGAPVIVPENGVQTSFSNKKNIPEHRRISCFEVESFALVLVEVGAVKHQRTGVVTRSIMLSSPGYILEVRAFLLKS